MLQAAASNLELVSVNLLKHSRVTCSVGVCGDFSHCDRDVTMGYPLLVLKGHEQPVKHMK